MMDNQKIKEFAKLIKNSNHIVFFGGAGVSTESGLKDYRSEDGIYTAINTYGYPPEDLLSHHFLYNRTDEFYRFYRDFFLVDVNPNPAHKSLAKLEEMGKLKLVVTQNVDGLHQKAGSKNVAELHGSAHRYYCASCYEKYDLDFIKNSKDLIPKCPKCGSFIRPDVVMYGEGLDDNTVSRTINEISKADMLIIGGTSLAVYPAASFIQFFSGKNLIIINKSETMQDSKATLVFRDSIGQVLDATVKELQD